MSDTEPLDVIVDRLTNPEGIPFTQFLMPDGRKRKQWIKRPREIEAQAFALIKQHGVSFEMELLSDYETVSFTTQIDSQDEPLAIELCKNGPPVPDAIDRLVKSTADALAQDRSPA